MSTAGHRNLQLQRNINVPDAYSGVTTVWLLSTLGGSRNANAIGVKKKDILSVSIPKTCEALLQNKSDYTLRSASNLLYGVTVCYGRKTDYVLADVTSVKSQLQRQLMETVRKGARVPMNNSNQIMIFDGVNEYRNMLEFQTMQSATQGQPQGRRSAFLVDDPTFDINQIRDISFLDGERRVLSQSASLIHQRDIMNELQNGYSSEKGPRIGEMNAHRTASFDYGELSALDADLHLDFDDVLSEVDMGSAKSSGEGNQDLSDREDFGLNFEKDTLNKLTHAVLPDLGMELLDESEEGESGKRSRSSVAITGSQAHADGSHSKRFKASKSLGVLLKLKIDDKIALANDALRDNSEKYCELMETRATIGYDNLRRPRNSNEWRTVIFGDDQPDFLGLCFQKLLLLSEDPSSFDDSSSIIDAVERGRQRVRSLPSSRSSSSAMSTEKGRKLGPADLFKNGSENNDNSFILPELHQIDENGELDDVYEEFDGGGEDLMRIDLQLPPSSFGRSSSRTEAGSRDQIEELKRMHSERRVNRNNTLQSVEDVDESPAASDSSHSRARSFAQSQILDNQSRRLFDYIIERASFIGRTTRSHPPYQKKLLLEDLLPSKLSSDISSTNSSDSVKPVSKKLAANAFLSILQLASKTYVHISAFKSSEGFRCLNGDDIVICV
ncbi:LANO_0C03224g1_1 [Lachancea nothofagi CBS 11611]|uniref:LANO_0C03224g1_1 n=1 Tax=Lachancea nothofagi CBS 11611 TaxID=1266666 RepID=A0A1G4J5T0_9SACH|nr:LANO_0C03224g1_1 [Lachancea nothofagi CBS 11611]